MLFARVVGTVVATVKDEKLVGTKLLMVQPVSEEGKARGNSIVAVDAIGAGEGELVLLVQGSSARQTVRTEGTPVDCVVAAIVDTIEKNGKAIFRKTTEQTAAK